VATTPPAPKLPVIYTQEDKNVQPPETVRQDMPVYPGRVPFDRSGILEIIIDVTGAVESATMLQSVEPLYNRLLLAAAKEWLYRPARLEGAPVKYRKRIQVALSRQ
jgi:hypothetical protein